MRIARIAAIGLALFAGAAHAQNIPKQISLIVPYPPGSTSDLIPRLIAPSLSQALGVTVIVENVPGANGSVGAQRVTAATSSWRRQVYWRLTSSFIPNYRTIRKSLSIR